MTESTSLQARPSTTRSDHAPTVSREDFVALVGVVHNLVRRLDTTGALLAKGADRDLPVLDELEAAPPIGDQSEHLRRTLRAIGALVDVAMPAESADAGEIAEEIREQIAGHRTEVLELVARLAVLVDEGLELEEKIWSAHAGTDGAEDRARAQVEALGLHDALDAISGLAFHVAEGHDGLPTELVHDRMHELTRTAKSRWCS